METYNGYVRTPADAIKLFEACRLGLLPRVQRRLSEKERQSIRSGSVFVWDEREAGMRRWTDGKSWSASRVSGSFLTYREMEGKRGSGFGNTRRSNGRTPDSGRMSDDDPDGEPEGYRYKADGLMKQSFSITTSQGQHLHLISYYSRPHPGSPDLPQPSSDPQLRHIIPAKGMYPESSLHDANPPALTRTPMQPYTTQSPPEQPAYGYTWGPPAWMGPWPPSPNGTPPWAQAQARHSPDAQSLHQARPPSRPLPQIRGPTHQGAPQLPPPPPTSAPGGPPPIYPKAIHMYEPDRIPHERLLPHERPSLPQDRSYHTQPVAQAMSPSPRLQQLQVQAAQAAAAAHAVMIDPRLNATSARNPQGPLPAMAPASNGLTPPRTHSVSPSHNGSPDGMNASHRASLSALLHHPTPSNSEPNSANPASSNSANSSPRTLTAGVSGPQAADSMFREDQRAISSLNRKFCI